MNFIRLASAVSGPTMTSTSYFSLSVMDRKGRGMMLGASDKRFHVDDEPGSLRFYNDAVKYYAHMFAHPITQILMNDRPS